jgi:hypothetical protein
MRLQAAWGKTWAVLPQAEKDRATSANRAAFWGSSRVRRGNDDRPLALEHAAARGVDKLRHKKRVP